MLVFVLGNAAAVHSLLSRYESALDQAVTLDRMRVSSQQLAVRAMRLSDGALVQAGQLSQEMDLMDRALQALDQGGVIDGREVPALAQAAARDFLPRIRRDWATLRGRVQTVLLGTYVRDERAAEAQELPQVVQRQWVADDAETLLGTLDACADVLMPLLREGKDRALLASGGLALLDLILLLGLYLMLRRHLVRPLRELRIACRELVQGHYDVRIGYRGRGELGQVARDFNDGIRQVHDLLAKMREDQAGLLRADTIFQGLASNSIVGIFLVENERFTFVSHKMAEIFGYEPREMIDAMTLLSIVAPRERFLMAESIKASQSRRDGTLRFERHGRRKDGSEIDIEVFSSTVRVGEQVSIIGIVQDITERKQAESSAQLAAIAYENSSEAIAITDSAGVVIDVNPAYSRMTGFWPDEIAGELLPLLRPGRHNRDFYDDMWHAINTQGRWEGEYWGQRKSGEDYAERVVMDTAWNHDGSVNCRVAMLSDVTQKKQIEAQIWNQAHHDPLTSLPNRQYFNERLRAAVQSADQSGQALALLFLDLDLFKEINDSMGHATGDRLLVEVARRLQACAAPETSFVARLGGDEFVVLVGDTPDKARIDALCRAILDRITKPYRLGGDPLRISASLGVALYPQDAEDAEALMRHVDMAMYVAKDSGAQLLPLFRPEHARTRAHAARPDVRPAAGHRGRAVLPPVPADPCLPDGAHRPGRGPAALAASGIRRDRPGGLHSLRGGAPADPAAGRLGVPRVDPATGSLAQGPGAGSRPAAGRLEGQGGQDGQRGDLSEGQAPGRQRAGREAERLQAAGQQRRAAAAPGAVRGRRPGPRRGRGLRRHVPGRARADPAAGCAASAPACRRPPPR
ncbi:hypothetical protein CDEN61S_03107 [Castellaniella denitrificans]